MTKKFSLALHFTISYSASVITVKKCEETENPNQFPHIPKPLTSTFVYLMTPCQKIDCAYGSSTSK